MVGTHELTSWSLGIDGSQERFLVLDLISFCCPVRRSPGCGRVEPASFPPVVRVPPKSLLSLTRAPASALERRVEATMARIPTAGKGFTQKPPHLSPLQSSGN